MQNLLNAKKAAQLLGVSIRTVHRLKKSGKLKFVQMRRLVRFRVEDVEAFAAAASKKSAR